MGTQNKYKEKWVFLEKKNRFVTPFDVIKYL